MSLIERDLQHIWHPCSQMKDYEAFPPLEIQSAQGVFLNLSDGRQLIDAISSWWCKSLGHNHPRLKRALLQQLDKFEHVILANTTNETIVGLAEQLCQLTVHLNKVFFASDGSCAVEIAMKMSLHWRFLAGDSQRTRFLALSNGYHGETMMTLAVSDLDLYKKPYESVIPDVEFIQEIPYVHSQDDPLWQDCSDYWPAIEAQLEKHASTTTAILVEPLIQGAGGMLIYSTDFLQRLADWARAHDIHLIADEIMTGFGRTGLSFAYQYASIKPDFVCASKGMTSGWLPMSAVLTSDALYDACYDDYETGKALMHSHTFTGNALAAAVACETLAVMRDEKINEKVQQQSPQWFSRLQEIANRTGRLENLRYLGGGGG